MESQKPKIAMYVKRNFGEKLSASFDFIKENWKLMLKFTTYLLFNRKDCRPVLRDVRNLSYSSAEFERTDGIYSGAD